jgi:hypothetical protein
LQRELDLGWRGLLGLLHEGSEDHDTLLSGRDIEGTCDAGFPLEPNLPELAADEADVRFLDVGRPTDSFNSEIRDKRARMSAGNSASSASTVSFNVLTVHRIAVQCGIERVSPRSGNPAQAVNVPEPALQLVPTREI